MAHVPFHFVYLFAVIISYHLIRPNNILLEQYYFSHVLRIHGPVYSYATGWRHMFPVTSK